MARTPLKRWVEVVEKAKWRSFADVKRDFASADYVGKGRYVFNIKGNDYRLVAVIMFVADAVFIRWVGTHSEYSRINVERI
jgi:mRNA interferase HigB